MSGTKFYIYASGRWREVDASSGLISGWGKARFHVSKRGKLAAARSQPILAALRALAEGQPSNARDGPPLSFKYPKGKEDLRMFKENGKSCDNCLCCHHNNYNGHNSTKDKQPNNRITVKNIVDAEIQTVAPKSDNVSKTRETSKRKRSLTPEDERKKRKRERSDDRQKRNRENLENESHSDSSGEEFQTKVITRATVHRAESNQKQNGNHFGSPKKGISNQSPKKVSSKRNPKEQSLSREGDTSVKKIQKSPNLKKIETWKRKRSSSSESTNSADSSENVGLSKLSQFLRKKSKRLKKESSKRENISLVVSSDSEEPKKSSANDVVLGHRSKQVAKNKLDTDEPVRKPGSERIASQNRSESIKEPVVKSPRKLAKNRSDTDDSVSKIVPKRIAPSKNTGDASSDENRLEKKQYKELLIDERDVEILRLYIQKHYPDDVLLRFDLDDDFKKLQFHKITPLVHIEFCPAIDRILHRRSQDSQITQSDFVSKLGLQSVTEISKPKRYKTRKQVNVSDTSEKENDINRNRENDKKIKEIEQKIKDNEKKIKDNVKKIKDNDKIIKDNEIMELSDSEPEVSQKSEIKKPLKKQPKVVSTKRPAFKEYSTLEDHAIVAWVSIGGRASCVNGNRLWRSLQEQYSRLTGHTRTWHSLRNRYLRYILPRLGALALPTAQQMRLRAAAAMGEIKSRKLSSKRNSIFEAPPRGAASRRPRLSSERDGLGTAPGTVLEVPGPATRSRRDPTPPPSTHRAPTPPLAKRRAPRTPRVPSPRYSDLTRKFAANKRARQHSSERSILRSQRRASSSSESTRNRPESTRNRPGSTRNRSESTRNHPESSQNKPHKTTRKSASNSSDSFESAREKTETNRNRSRASKRKRSESPDESNRYKSHPSVRDNIESSRNESPETINSGSSSESRYTKANRKLSKNKARESNRNKSESKRDKSESNVNKPESNSDSSFEVEKRKNKLILNGRSRSKIISYTESRSSSVESVVKSREPKRQSLRHKTSSSETRRVSLRRKMSPESDRKSAESDKNKSVESKKNDSIRRSLRGTTTTKSERNDSNRNKHPESTRSLRIATLLDFKQVVDLTQRDKLKRNESKRNKSESKRDKSESNVNKPESNSDSSFEVEKRKNKLILNGRSRSKIISYTESRSSSVESVVESREPKRQSLRHKTSSSETRRVSLRRKMSPESDRKSAESDKNKSVESKKNDSIRRSLRGTTTTKSERNDSNRNKHPESTRSLRKATLLDFKQVVDLTQRDKLKRDESKRKLSQNADLMKRSLRNSVKKTDRRKLFNPTSLLL